MQLNAYFLSPNANLKCQFFQESGLPLFQECQELSKIWKILPKSQGNFRKIEKRVECKIKA